MISWRATLLAGAVIGLACVPTDGCGCTPALMAAGVFGRVQTGTGAPVANATVFAYIARGGDCSRRDDSDGSGVSRDDGTYTVNIASIEQTDTACVLVHVRAPLGSGLLDPPDTTVTLAIRATAPFDSARVDATLSAP
jgi:hypothetical protein